MTSRRHRAAPPAVPPPHASPWLALAIVIAGLLAYANSFSGPFVFDDQLSVVENTSIRQGWNLGQVLFPERELPTAGRPLVNLSFALNYAAGGLDVTGYHLLNLALHLACAIMLYAAIRLGLVLSHAFDDHPAASSTVAVATALLWVVHPLNTEAVDYLTQRTEVMMALAYLGTVYCAARAWLGGWRWQAGAVLACAAGMACKESMVTAPVAVILFDVMVGAHGSLRSTAAARWKLWAGLASTWLLLALLMWSGPRIHSAGFGTEVSPWTYLLNQTVMIVGYLRRTIWPSSLVVNYGWPPPVTVSDVLPYAIATTGAFAAALAAAVRWPRPGFLGAWFFLTLAPTSSIVPIATEVGADRRMYLPIIGVLLLLVLAIDRLLRGRTRALQAWRHPTFVVAVLLSVVLATVTALRNREYQSGLQLARTVVERHPTPVAYHMLGAELGIAGRSDEAIAALRRALPGAARAYYTLGIELFKRGDYDAAIAEFAQFVARQPRELEVLNARDLTAQAHLKRGRMDQAVAQYRELVSMAPRNAQYRLRLAETLLRGERFHDAVGEYEEYLKMRPGDGDALTRLAVALVASGRLDDAVAAFRRALAVTPNSADAERNLANALLDAGRGEEAFAHARRAVALNPRDAGAYDALGRSLATRGSMDEAARQFEQALRLDPRHQEAQENLAKLRALAGGVRRAP